MNALQIFKKAKKLLDQDAVRLVYIKDDKIFFEVLSYSDRHDVTLTFNKVGNGLGIYQKIWSCTCQNSSIKGMLHNAVCSHVLAAEGYLINNINKFIKLKQ